MKEEGIFGFYKGLFASLISLVPFAAINLSLYQYQRDFYSVRF